MTSVQNDRDFKKEIMDQIPDDLLQTTIDWIKKQFDPEDIFDEVKLKRWAEDSGYRK